MLTVKSDDELNLAGLYLSYGNLPSPKCGKKTSIYDGAEYFDDLYFEENGVSRTGSTSQLEMARSTIDLMISREVGLQKVKRSTRKVGRNEPCPCGNGRKYKRCHGV